MEEIGPSAKYLIDLTSARARRKAAKRGRIAI
jgi:hypothetical protein